MSKIETIPNRVVSRSLAKTSLTPPSTGVDKQTETNWL